ncbi:hypothetical protein HUE56_14135 [Azospirillum oryzae]|uniref:Uncharacterized protein n=1 Tax=Azospirillum oryzae TaxID=286727 RepID=A0A6N1AIP9_9PROT|nr:hypothetical protein [Azospirillum oryzae]KAA0589765.1 hypothetical protein FZ938_09145 [Azospirillum oryzae]QKS51601.1 hypothetical protein HUE56_14135 [Azospirillum oryzae]GLR78463.1 hypothetical protein GCM10007856_11350 [Azospirillum oryzae]
MSNNAEILNAILDLKTHFDGRFERLEQRLDRLARPGDGGDQRLDGIDHRLKDLQVTVHNQGERISRMEGRLDEQSRILAAMITTRVAAVPPAAE